MARGVSQLKLDLKPLCRSDLRVHSGAQAAYEYYRDFLKPTPRNDGHQEIPASPVIPIIEVVPSNARYLVVAGFPKFRLFGYGRKQECALYVLDQLNGKQITRRAWRSVMQYESFSPAPADIVCAKILRLINHFPAALVSECLPRDPKTGTPPGLNCSALARALGVSLSTLNNELPRIRNGGVADISIDQIISDNQEGTDSG